jgi:hypothetical protein
VEEDDDLRLRREPFVAINPTTGATIAIKAAQADAEIRVNGQWMKLTRFRGHPKICVEGVHDAKQGKEASTIPA